MQLADAKARIAIYGDSLVAEALACFFAKHGALTSPEAISAFSQVFVLMRVQTMGSSREVSQGTVRHLLFS